MDQLSGYEKLSGLIIIFEDAKVKSQVGIKIYGPLGLTTNGTAVEGVCVTGVAIRPIVQFASMELSRWQAGMAQYLQSRVRLAKGSRFDDERC
jgi:hypothetical protein